MFGLIRLKMLLKLIYRLKPSSIKISRYGCEIWIYYFDFDFYALNFNFLGTESDRARLNLSH